LGLSTAGLPTIRYLCGNMVANHLLRRLPEWGRARLRDEQRQAKQAADIFACVCRDGEADRLYNAHLALNDSSSDAWRLAMAKVAKLPRVSPAIQHAFLPIWIESKMLPLRVGPTMAAALRLLLPGEQLSSPLMLYRGTHDGERRRRLYGFSWTTDIVTARSFAEHWSQSVPGNKFQGLVLQTEAPPEAVLLIRKPEDYYDEGEVVVDPFRLGRVEVVERLTIPPLDEVRGQ
jgi:hypothetical protein